MKRISILAMTLVVMLPVLTQGYYGYRRIPLRYRTRYSPYAFNYHHCGLISGYLSYSPYAFGPGSTGLVPYWINYNPYAFNTKHSGLISDYGFYYGDIHHDYATSPCGCTHHNATDCQCETENNNSCNTWVDTGSNYLQKKLQRRQPRRNEQTIKQLHENDPKEIIAAYLTRNDMGDFETDRLLKIDDKTVSVNFVFKDDNIIVKYWNTREIKALDRKAEYKKNFFYRYRQAWEQFRKKYEGAGGKVLQIGSPDGQETVAKLQPSQQLTGG